MKKSKSKQNSQLNDSNTEYMTHTPGGSFIKTVVVEETKKTQKYKTFNVNEEARTDQFDMAEFFVDGSYV